METDLECPKKGNAFLLHCLINLCGGAAFLLTVFTIHDVLHYKNYFISSVIGLLVAFAVIVFCEIKILKVHKRARVFQQAAARDKGQIKTKICGLGVTLYIVAMLYSLIPEYRSPIYHSFFSIFPFLLAIFLVGGIAYIIKFNAYLGNQKDGLWHFGNVFLGSWSDVDRFKVAAYLKSVLLRAYFAPVMFYYLLVNMNKLTQGMEAFTKTSFGETVHLSYGAEFFKFAVIVYACLCTTDLVYAFIGYIIMLKMLDSDARSIDCSLLGWVACIVCYHPFFHGLYIFNNMYVDPPQWTHWLSGHDILKSLWVPLIVLAMSLEASVMIVFGIRFSNLTYRGLLSGGLFGLTKHPQYVTKFLCWFLIMMPFMSDHGLPGVLQNMSLFAGMAFIYFLRARTEENHLAQYPEYIAYAQMIEQRGLFRFMGKIFPFLKFSEARAKTGKIF